MVGVDTGSLFRRTRDTNRLHFLSKSLWTHDSVLHSLNKPGELYGDSITNNAIGIIVIIIAIIIIVILIIAIAHHHRTCNLKNTKTALPRPSG